MRTPDNITYEEDQKVWRYVRVHRFEQMMTERRLHFVVWFVVWGRTKLSISKKQDSRKNEGK